MERGPGIQTKIDRMIDCAPPAATRVELCADEDGTSKHAEKHARHCLSAFCNIMNIKRIINQIKEKHDIAIRRKATGHAGVNARTQLYVHVNVLRI